MRKVAMSSGQCTEGGLKLGREHAVEEGGSEQEAERSFGKVEKKSEDQEVRQMEERFCIYVIKKISNLNSKLVITIK